MTLKVRAWLTVAVLVAYLVAFGLPIVGAVRSLTDPDSTAVLTESDLMRFTAFNVLAIVVAAGVYIAFRRAGVPLGGVATAGRRGLRVAAFVAGIWTVSQMLSLPITLIIDALVDSPDYPDTSTTASTALQGIAWASWAFAAGFGEEIIANAAVVRTCELYRAPAWVVYSVAVVARLAYHVYYGWAVLEKTIWALGAAWAYRNSRIIWPLIAIHTFHDLAVRQSHLWGMPWLRLLEVAINLGLLVFVIATVVSARRERTAA
ncbi:CPBP family glutamic-type intramembrane protease [Nocardia sp. IFM 10818]